MTPVRWEGKRFGKWTAISRNMDRVSRSGRPVSAWNCRCDCGVVRVVSYHVLWSGKTRGCEACTAAMHPSSGVSTHHLGRTWCNMISRCHSETSRSYPAYGARGITVCDGWKASFFSFVNDMGARPGPEYSVDRIDNLGGYWCGRCDQCRSLGRDMNCRWATHKQQVQNSRTPRFVEFDGNRLCLSDWAKRVGITREAMRRRVDACIASGRPVSDAIGPRRGGGGRRSLTKVYDMA